jgi:hypothetical protein
MPIPHASIRAAVPHSHPVPHAIRGAIWIPAIWIWLRRCRARLLSVCADTAQRAGVRSNNTTQSREFQRHSRTGSECSQQQQKKPRSSIATWQPKKVHYSNVATEKHMRSETPVVVAENRLLVHRIVQV